MIGEEGGVTYLELIGICCEGVKFVLASIDVAVVSSELSELSSSGKLLDNEDTSLSKEKFNKRP